MAKTLATTVPVYEYTGPPWRLPYEILRPPTTIWNHRRPPLLASRQNREHGAGMNWTSSTGPCCCRYSERVRRAPPLPRRAMTEKVKISRRCKKKKEVAVRVCVTVSSLLGPGTRAATLRRTRAGRGVGRSKKTPPSATSPTNAFSSLLRSRSSSQPASMADESDAGKLKKKKLGLRCADSLLNFVFKV